MNQADTLMIGAGPSGLSCALGLEREACILEALERPGGLCRSFTRDGGVFDLGGHSFHTPYDDVYSLVQSLFDGALYRQKRRAMVYAHSQLIPYPYQKHFEAISDKAIVQECREGLATRREQGAAPANFEEWILQRFGEGVARHFMLPYNRKLWARDLKRISSEWTAQRVAEPKGASVDETFKTAGGGKDRRPLQSDSIVAYPPCGGFEEIFKNMAAQIPNIHYNKRVARIDPAAKVVRCEDHSEYGYGCLISSMPLPELVAMLDGVPAGFIAQSKQLEYMSLRVDYLLAGRKLDTDVQRIYCGDNTCPSHKIALNHNSSDYLRGVNRHAIMAEVSVSPYKTDRKEEGAPKTIDLLVHLGILKSAADIIWSGSHNIQYGYPVYTHERAAIIEPIKQWLLERGIHTIGRFGEWEYINSDACIKKGLDLSAAFNRRRA
jgi:UDP-galactopyranose mutase